MGADPLRGPWLKRRVHPARVVLFARLGSTNRTAVDHLNAGRLKPPAILVASLQTAGRGQRTNRWWSDEGSLCVTFILPVDASMPIGQVPLRAGLAVASVVTSFLPNHRVQVKWPNDVLVDGKKIAGILCLRERGADVIGIGLNVGTSMRDAPSEVRTRATSMRSLLTKPPRRDEVLAALWSALLAERASNDWNERFRAIHALEHRNITIDDNGALVRGTCRGIDADGRLLLDHDGSVRAITSGTVVRW